MGCAESNYNRGMQRQSYEVRNEVAFHPTGITDPSRRSQQSPDLKLKTYLQHARNDLGRDSIRNSLSDRDIIGEQLLEYKEGKTQDRRERITCHKCLSRYPYNCIGFIFAENDQDSKGIESKGTGFLISKNSVLTCAHLLLFIAEDTKKVTFLKPKSFYISAVGDFRKIDGRNVYKIYNYVINPQYVANLQKIAEKEIAMKEFYDKMTGQQF